MESAGGEIKGGEQECIVAEVEQITGQNGSGDGADVSEKNPDQDEQHDLSPTAPELHGVKSAKNNSGKQDSAADAGGSREEWIEISAEESFFRQGSDDDGHHHHDPDAAAILKKQLDRQFGLAANQAGSERR